MSVLVDLVSTVKQLSDTPDKLRQLLGTLQQREDQLIQMLPQLDDAMEALTPSMHTLGLIFILCVTILANPIASSCRLGLPQASLQAVTSLKPIACLLQAHD